jgi:two-component system cell cycle response regulator
VRKRASRPFILGFYFGRAIAHEGSDIILSATTQQSKTLLSLLGDPAELDRVAISTRVRSIDPELWRHAAAVAEFVDAMASLLPGVTATQRGQFVDAAWMHDIGKLTMQREALLRPGPLSDAEWIEMRDHPTRGADYLDQSTLLREIAPLVRQHHEWHDGHGYPGELRGDRIQLGARLIGVADAYDAMTSWRPYRPLLAEIDAVAELQRCAGSQFDPDTVALFIRATDGLRARPTR